MKKLIIILLFLVGYPCAIIAQTKPDLRKLSEEEKMQTMAFKSTTVLAGSIAYAKSIGKTPKEYGQAIGKLFSPGWKRSTASGTGMERIVEHMNSIAQGFGTSIELINWSNNEATIKRGMLLQEQGIARMFMSLGVTAQDMEDWDEGVTSEIATSLGLSMSQRKDEQNVIITLKKL